MSSRDNTIQVALIGQPNVGKSTLFTRLTGVGVISSNYPGTTVEFEESTVIRKGINLHVHDLPGTYSLSTNSEDERIVIKMLLDGENDAVVIVADASNPEPSITFASEVIEMGVPAVMALNRIDLAEKYFEIDVERLSSILGIPVIPVSARNGTGIEELLDALTDGRARASGFRVRYDGHIVDYVNELCGFLEDVPEVNRYGISLKLLEGVSEVDEIFGEKLGEYVREMQNEFASIHDDSIDVHIGRDRYAQSAEIVFETVRKTSREKTLSEKISDLTVSPLTGFPILFGVLGLTLGILIVLGSFLDGLINDVYEMVVGDSLTSFGESIGGELGSAIMGGINNSILAILALVIPYIMVFYIILGILEDSGYLPRVVVLLDRLMHRFGLHGGGFIPMMVGVGCNVPAIMATRSLSSKRERRVLCTMIIICVPCSAQLAIIVGTTGVYAGLQYAAIIVAVLLAIGFCVGLALNKILPQEPSNLAMELPDLILPQFRNVLYKMWSRTKDFFSLAVPMLIIGSVIVEILIVFDLLHPIVEPMSWLTEGLLGLPAVTIMGFLVGVLRKEMSYGMLLILAEAEGFTDITQFMTPDQFVVFGMVMAVYLPCIATLGTLARELGWKDTVLISASSIAIAVAIGTVFNMMLHII